MKAMALLEIDDTHDDLPNLNMVIFHSHSTLPEGKGITS